jgi:hypothetical protein
MTTTGPNIDKERAVETYKSLIQISVEGFKLLAVLNGGAAIALLAYLGNTAGRTKAPDMRFPMSCYVAGLVLCGLAFVASYVTQFSLYNEAMGRAPDRAHMRWVRIGLALAFLSLIAFAVGSVLASVRFR